jgi:hypothetical protein
MITAMSWLLILVLSVIVVGFLSTVVGRWLQRKGSETERRRRQPPR